MEYFKKYHQQVPGEANHPNLPLLYTPFSKISEYYLTHTRGPCAAYEIDLYRCLARTGRKRGETECHPYIQDFKECFYQSKGSQRYKIMQEERKRQKRPSPEVPEPDSVEKFGV